MKESKREVKRLLNDLVYRSKAENKSLYKGIKNLLFTEIEKAYHKGFYEGLNIKRN